MNETSNGAGGGGGGGEERQQRIQEEEERQQRIQEQLRQQRLRREQEELQARTLGAAAEPSEEQERRERLQELQERRQQRQQERRRQQRLRREQEEQERQQQEILLFTPFPSNTDPFGVRRQIPPPPPPPSVPDIPTGSLVTITNPYRAPTEDEMLGNFLPEEPPTRGRYGRIAPIFDENATQTAQLNPLNSNYNENLYLLPDAFGVEAELVDEIQVADPIPPDEEFGNMRKMTLSAFNRIIGGKTLSRITNIKGKDFIDKWFSGYFKTLLDINSRERSGLITKQEAINEKKELAEKTKKEAKKYLPEFDMDAAD